MSSSFNELSFYFFLFYFSHFSNFIGPTKFPHHPFTATRRHTLRHVTQAPRCTNTSTTLKQHASPGTSLPHHRHGSLPRHVALPTTLGHQPHHVTRVPPTATSRNHGAPTRKSPLALPRLALPPHPATGCRLGGHRATMACRFPLAATASRCSKDRRIYSRE